MGFMPFALSLHSLASSVGADAGFAAWFKQRVLEISGIDENKMPLGPETEQIFEFKE